MKINWKDLAGGGGQVGTYLDGARLTIDTTLCAAAGPETFGLACLSAIIDAFRLAWDLFFGSIFPSRAKVGPHSATDSVALFLIPSPNPVIALWGIGIRMLEAAGCSLSGGGPCRVAFQRLAQAARADLIRQFGGAGVTYFAQYAYLQGLSNPASNRAAIAGRAQVDARYTAAVANGTIDPRTGFPKIRCPQGYHLSPSGETCLRDTAPPPPPPACPPGFHRIGHECIRNEPIPPRAGVCACNPPNTRE